MYHDQMRQQTVHISLLIL